MNKRTSGTWPLLLMLAACFSESPPQRGDGSSDRPLSASDPDVLWIVDHETGDLSQWDGKGPSGKANAYITSEKVHSGRYALAATVYDGTRAGSGIRMRIEGRQWAAPDDPRNLPDSGYYSIWYYIPRANKGNNNILQWKQAEKVRDDRQLRRLTLSVSIRRGEYLALRTRIDDRGRWVKPSIELDRSELPVPYGRWFHLECFLAWRKTPDGQIACWQDETEILHADHVITERDLPWLGYPRQWTVNNYGISPQDPARHTLYIDDVVLSRSRVGTRPLTGGSGARASSSRSRPR